MARYFKIVEITREEFVSATGEDISIYSQVMAAEKDGSYVAVDDDDDYMDISIEAMNFVGVDTHDNA